MKSEVDETIQFLLYVAIALFLIVAIAMMAEPVDAGDPLPSNPIICLPVGIVAGDVFGPGPIDVYPDVPACPAPTPIPLPETDTES